MASQDIHSTKQYHINMGIGDIVPTVLIPGDPSRVEVFASLMDEAMKVAENREFISYRGTKDGIEISCTSTGLGCPPTAIGVEELIRIGAKNIIRIGTCGAIQDFIEPGHMIIATGSVRGEHTSEEFISMEYPAVADYRVVRALIDACEKLGLIYHLGVVRTHDAYYMESPLAHGDFYARIKPWQEMSILAIENESSALFTICSMQGVRAGAIFACGYPIYQPDADNCDWDSYIKNMVLAGIEAAKLLNNRGLA